MKPDPEDLKKRAKDAARIMWDERRRDFSKAAESFFDQAESVGLEIWNPNADDGMSAGQYSLAVRCAKDVELAGDELKKRIDAAAPGESFMSNLALLRAQGAVREIAALGIRGGDLVRVRKRRESGGEWVTGYYADATVSRRNGDKLSEPVLRLLTLPGGAVPKIEGKEKLKPLDVALDKLDLNTMKKMRSVAESDGRYSAAAVREIAEIVRKSGKRFVWSRVVIRRGLSETFVYEAEDAGCAEDPSNDGSGKIFFSTYGKNGEPKIPQPDTAAVVEALNTPPEKTRLKRFKNAEGEAVLECVFFGSLPRTTLGYFKSYGLLDNVVVPKNYWTAE